MFYDRFKRLNNIYLSGNISDEDYADLGKS